MAQYSLYKNKKNESMFLQGMGGFMILWFGQIVSLTGSGITCFAQSVWVYTDLGSSITHLTALAVLARLPGVIVSPIAGVVADRFNRKTVMIISDTVAALATFTLRTLVVTNTFQIWHIYAVVIIISIANHFHWPAYFSTISLMVPKNKLGSANGLVQIGRAFGQIAAPFAAGVLITFFKIQGVFIFDLATYVISLITLLIVPIPRPPLSLNYTREKVSLFKDIMDGWKYLAAKKGLVSILKFFSLSNFLLGIIGVLAIPLVLSFTTSDVLGTVFSLGGACMLLGSLVMAFWGNVKRYINGILVFTLIQGIAVVFAGISPLLPLIIGATAIFYFASPIVSSCGNVIWQQKVEAGMQGRAFAASGMVSMASIQLGYLVAGPLADLVFEPLLKADGLLAGSVGKIIGTGPGRGIGLMFIIFGLLCVALTIFGFFNPRLKKLETELEDAVVQKKKWESSDLPAFPGDGM